MKIILKLLALSALLFHLSCFDVIGSSEVFELDNLSFIITEKEVSNSKWKVGGTVVNTGDAIIEAPWYIEAMFYADSTYTTTFGGDSKRMNYPLESGTTTYWSLTHRSETVIETNYPNFTINNLRAYIEK